MGVILDIIDGNLAEQTETGWRIDRIATVTGLSGSGYAKALQATTQSGMPRIGESHPALATAILRNIKVMSVTSEDVTIRMLYSEDFYGEQNESVITGGATATQVETNQGYFVNSSGTPSTTKTDIRTFKGIKKTGVLVESTGALVPVFTPDSTIEISRIEETSGSALNDKALKFVAKVNKGGWLLRPFHEERSWLCTGITFISTDGGKLYTVNYSFQYKKDLWDAEVVYLDPDTGRPLPNPDDPDPNTGEKPEITDDTVYGPVYKYQVHDTEDFNLLGLK